MPSARAKERGKENPTAITVGGSQVIYTLIDYSSLFPYTMYSNLPY